MANEVLSPAANPPWLTSIKYFIFPPFVVYEMAFIAIYHCLHVDFTIYETASPLPIVTF